MSKIPDRAERCDRCGLYGYDRRTLNMSCGYDMREMGLPFDVRDNAPVSSRFYTLRVCKCCRSGWMDAIKWWFHDSLARQSRDESDYGSENLSLQHGGRDAGE